MKESYNLIAGTDEMSGEIGLKFEDLPYIDWDFSMGDGLLIAHDLLEHQNGFKNIGSIGDELQALGGIWFVRGQHSDITRTYNVNTPHQHVASDVMRMAFDYANGEGFGCAYPDKEFYEEDEYEDEYKEIIKEAVKSYRAEYGEEEVDKQLLKEYWHSVKPFMRQGMAKAEKRYEDNPSIANYLFWNIVEAVNALSIDEGQQFTLIVDYEDGTCAVHEDVLHDCDNCGTQLEEGDMWHTDYNIYCEDCYDEQEAAA